MKYIHQEKKEQNQLFPKVYIVKSVLNLVVIYVC